MSRKRLGRISILFVSVLLGHSVLAAQSKPVGVGGLLGELTGDGPLARDFAAIIDGNNHFRQRMTVFGVRQYGFGHSRLEIGTGIGVHLEATSGITLVGLEGDAKIFPHIGMEPMSGRINWSTRDQRIDYYEWLPMMSVGIQGQVKGCRILPLVRAGGGVGTLNRGESSLVRSPQRAYGLGAHFNCSRFDFALESTHLGSGVDRTQFATMDLALQLRPDWQFGVRAERLNVESLSGESAEKRVIFTIRGNLFDR